MQFNCLEAIAYFTSLSRNPKFSWQIANNHILSNYCLALLFISFSHHYINESLAGKKKDGISKECVFSSGWNGPTWVHWAMKRPTQIKMRTQLQFLLTSSNFNFKILKMVYQIPEFLSQFPLLIPKNICIRNTMLWINVK